MKYVLLFLSLCTQLTFAQETLNTEMLEGLSFKTLDSLIAVPSAQGNLPLALEYINIAAQKAREEFGEIDSTYNVYLGKQGLYYTELGQYEKGEVLLEESVALSEKIFGKNHDSYTTATGNLAYYYLKMGRFDAAEPLFLEAVEINKSLLGPWDPSYALSINDLASLYFSLGQFEKAEPLFLQALRIRKKAYGEMNNHYATSLSDLSVLYFRMGKYEEAAPLIKKASEIRKEISGESNYLYSYTLNTLASLKEEMGDYEGAEPLFLQAVQITKNALGTAHPAYLTAQSNLGNLCIKKGDYAQAKSIFTEVLEGRKKVLGESHPDYGTTLSLLAATYVALGNFEAAEKLQIQAMVINEKVFGKKHLNYANGLSGLALFYIKFKNYPAAKAAYAEELKILQENYSPTNSYYINLLNNLADYYAKTNELDAGFAHAMSCVANNSNNFGELFPNLFAEDSLIAFNPNLYRHQLSLEQVSKIPQLDVRHSIAMNEALESLTKITKLQYLELKEKGDTKAYQEKFQLHYALVKAAMQFNEQIRNDFSGKENKLRVLQRNGFFVKHGIQVALEENTKDRLAEAFSFSELNKSVLLADAVKGNRAKTLSDLPDTIAFKEIRLQEQKSQLKKELYEANNESEKTALNDAQIKLNLEIEAFLQVLKKDYPKYHQLKYQNITAKAKDIQDLLAPKTLLLEYFVTQDIIYLFALSKDNIELFPIEISLPDLKIAIKELRFALSNYDLVVKNPDKAFKLYTTTAHRFYEKFLKIALDKKDMEHLILVTDGEFGHLPFEALLLDLPTDQKINYNQLHYLVNDYKISYNYSATLWKSQLNENSTPKNTAFKSGQFLACAAHYPPLSTWEQIDSNLSQRRLPHLLDLRAQLAPLPAAQNEVEALSKVFQGNFLFTKPDSPKEAASETFFKNNASNYGVIHLAMHGILHPRVPILSSLAFTEDKDSLEDNFLEAYEIAHLKLNADLVVLSACETGYGKFEQGEGVVSLARSFMYAGVPSLVVSLWQVNDNSTAAIMISFYNYLAEGMPKDMALQQAKLDYIKKAKGVTGHPAFWSPFIQLGDSRPISLKTKGSWMPWILGGGLSCLFVLGFFILSKKRKSESA